MKNSMSDKEMIEVIYKLVTSTLSKEDILDEIEKIVLKRTAPVGTSNLEILSTVTKEHYPNAKYIAIELLEEHDTGKGPYMTWEDHYLLDENKKVIKGTKRPPGEFRVLSDIRKFWDAMRAEFDRLDDCGWEGLVLLDLDTLKLITKDCWSGLDLVDLNKSEDESE